MKSQGSHLVQRGIGLVEVMIALTIGLVLLLGVSQAFLTMRETATTAQQLSAVQNQQRMAMYFLHVAVSGAGFNPDPVAKSGEVLYPVSGVFTAPGQTLLGTGAGAAADTLSVRFTASAGGAQQGCSASLVAGHTYTNRFNVANGFLTCSETDNTAATAATTLNLIGGLAGMNIVYGVDSTGGGSVTQYLTGAQVTAANFWGNVKTAQVTLLFTNALAGQPGQPQTVSLVETIPYMANI